MTGRSNVSPIDSPLASERGAISALLSRGLAQLGSGPVWVHADPFRAARLVPRTSDRDDFLDSHLDLIKTSAQGRPIWMPAFNYDFPRTRTFDVRRDPSQLGPIPERFRTNASEWRTEIPIFSASGTGAAPAIEWGEETDPFGTDSIFAKLVGSDGVILYYGDTFHYNTLVHFAERAAGNPAYRYDKIFEGTVTRDDGTSVRGSLRYHVRPLGRALDYDWPVLLRRALDSGACVRLEDRSDVLASSASALTQFFVDELERDPLSLLDQESRSWVEPLLSRLGRRFVLSDFETVET